MENRRSCIDALAMKRHPAKHWRAGALSVTFCAVAASAMATVSYTYENDNKTLVATVTDANTDMSSAEAEVLNGNSVTNFVLRGDYRLIVASGMAGGFTGDILIDGASTSDQKNLLVLESANAMGIDHGPGTITLQHGGLVPANNTIVAKDIAFGLNHSDWGGRMFQIWEARNVKVNGKITTGNRNADIIGYKNSNLTIAGGLEDPLSGGSGYAYFALYGGARVKIEDHPVIIKNGFYFRYTDVSSSYDSNGFQGYVDFAVAGNSMGALGWDTGSTSYRLRRYKVKTTADWAFDKSNMKVFVAYDGMWDLCGTSQRVGQFDVRMPNGANASVITNSLETPATLYLGQIYNYPDTSLPADIRFGGNLSVVFEGNIHTTRINYPMTATGDLTLSDQGTLAFLENGSWANATNVTVSGTGKITIANPNALGRRANVNLKSNSSLEIASGVTVCVKTLTVGGVQQRRGDYTFGSGTLRVSHPCGFQLRLR